MSNTLKRRKSLRSKLLKFCNGGFWTIFEVEGAIFTEEIAAWRRARKLARVTGNGVTIWKTKVPHSLPSSWSQELKAVDGPIQAEPPLHVFIVDGKIFTDIDDASQAADNHAKSTKQFTPVWGGIINMEDLELIGGSTAHRRAVMTTCEPTDATKPAAEGGAE